MYAFLCRRVLSFLGSTYPEEKALGLAVTLSFTSEELFCWPHPFLFPPAVPECSRFSISMLTLAITFRLDWSAQWAGNSISLRICSAFPWWSPMLSIFPGSCWPFVCLLRRHVCSSHLPMFTLDYFKIIELREVFIHLIQVSYRMKDSQTSSRIP